MSISVTTFGASPSASAATNTAAFNAALGVGGCITVPSGAYNVSGTLTFTQNGTRLLGDGRGCTSIVMQTAGVTVLSAGGPLSNVEISGLTIDSSVTAIAGQIGIDFYPSTSQACISDVAVQHQYTGVRLSNTDFSTFEDSYVTYNQSHGVLVTNSPSGAAVQWQLDNILSSSNGGIGFFYDCTGTASMSVGQCNRLATYANSSFGFAAQGSPNGSINGFRVMNSFFGQDGNSEVYLQTYSTYPHMFTGISCELCGTGATGPTGSTPASHVGSGFQISAVDNLVSIVNTTIDGCSQDGIQMNGLRTSAVKVIGGAITNNSQASPGSRFGIIAQGPIFVSGTAISGASQAYGVYLASTSDHSNISNNDLRGNGTGALSNSGTNTYHAGNAGLDY